MKLPLWFDFGPVAEGELDPAANQLRLDAKTFLQNVESSALMGTLDPSEIGLIATASMRLAIKKFSDFEAEEKRDAMGWLITTLAHLKQLEKRMDELRQEISDLESEIRELEDNYAQLSSELDEINALLDPTKGGEGDYDRARALQLLRLPPGSDMADADIQTLLWERKVALTENMAEIEAHIGRKRNRLNDARNELDTVEDKISSLKSDLDMAETPEEIRELADQTRSQASPELLDQDGFDQRDTLMAERPAPSGMGGI